MSKRKAFVLPGTIFFLAWYMGFILLTAYAEDFMSRRVYEGLTVGYCLALTQFVMVLVLGLLYLKKSSKVFDPLAAKAIEKYEGHHQRFARVDDHGDDGRLASRHPDHGGAVMTVVFAEVNTTAVVVFSVVLRSRSASPTGRPSAPRAPSASTPPGAASPASRTASRSRATTCRPPRSSASPA